MKKLDVVHSVYSNGHFLVYWHRYNDDNADNDCGGVWDWKREVKGDELLHAVQAMCDPDISVAIL